MRRSTFASSCSSALDLLRQAVRLGDRVARRPRPRAWPAAICSETLLLAARRSSTCGSSSRRAASSSSSSSTSPAAPRRARAALTPSGSLRISLRSSVAPPVPSAARAPVVPPLGGRQARRALGRLARVLGDELGDRLRVTADDDVLRHDRAGEAAVADRVEDLVLGLLALVQVRAGDALLGVAALGAGGIERMAAGAPLARTGRPRGCPPPCRCCRTRRSRSALAATAATSAVPGGGGSRAASYRGRPWSPVTEVGEGRPGPRGELVWRPAPAGQRAFELHCLERDLHEIQRRARNMTAANGSAPGGFPLGCEDSAPCAGRSTRPSSGTHAGGLPPACASSRPVGRGRAQRDDGQRGHLAVARAAADDRVLRAHGPHAGGRRALRGASGSTSSRTTRRRWRPASPPRCPRRQKFSGLGWSRAQACPRSQAASAWLGCELRELTPAGDHLIGVGEVVDLWSAEGDPLVFFRGDYWALSSREEAPPEVDRALEGPS